MVSTAYYKNLVFNTCQEMFIIIINFIGVGFSTFFMHQLLESLP